MVDDTFDRYVLPYLLLPIILLLFAAWHWLSFLGWLHESPWISTVVALAALLYSAWKLASLRKRLKAMKQGQLGEMAVGQYLDSLRAHGYEVIHDVPCLSLIHI